MAIEVPAADSVDARGVVDTCVSALGPERCWLVGERDVTPRWDASIEHRDAGRLVVTLRLHGDEREAVARWELAFDAGDPPQQRWASAGVVVAALVVAESPAPAEFPAPAPASPRPEPEPPAPAAAPATQRMPSPRAVAPGGLGAAGIDAALLAGPGLTGGSARVGGLLRGFVGLRSSLMLGAELRCATGIIRGPDSAWLSAGLGPGARLGRWDAPIAVEATTQLVVEGLFVQARDALGADRAARARLGGRVAVDGVARLAAPVGVLIGGDVSLLAPPIRVEVAHATAGREPVVGWSAHAGLRVLLR